MSTVYLTTLNGDTFEILPNKILETAKEYFSPEFDDDIHFIKYNDDNKNDKYMMFHSPLETQTYITIKPDNMSYEIDYRVLDLQENEIVHCTYRIREKDDQICNEIDKEIAHVIENDKKIKEELTNGYITGFVWLNDPKRAAYVYPLFSLLVYRIQKEGPMFGKTARACQYETEFVQYRLQVEWNRFRLNQQFKQMREKQYSLGMEVGMEEIINNSRVANHPVVKLSLNMLKKYNKHDILPVFKHLTNDDEMKEQYNEFSEKMREMDQIQGIQQACMIM